MFAEFARIFKASNVDYGMIYGMCDIWTRIKRQESDENIHFQKLLQSTQARVQKLASRYPKHYFHI